MATASSAADRTAAGLTVVLGGARSGKSSFALRHALRHPGRVAWVATAPTGLDDDLDARIRRHRDERPAEWTTHEVTTDLIGAVDTVDAVGAVDTVDAVGAASAIAAIDSVGAAAPTLVVIDCLTLWVSNLMWAGSADDEVIALADRTAAHCHRRAAPTLVVSNEVGLGIHPETDLGRRYRDVLGWVNQRWTAVADRSLLFVAGRALRLEDPDTLL